MKPDSGTTLAASDLQAAVAAEVERQVGALRDELESRIDAVRERAVEDRATLVVFSGELDKAMAAFIIATGAAAAGLETSMFFTFWGLSVLRKAGAASAARTPMERMVAMMTPGSSDSLGLSKMNYFGLGARMLRRLMKEKDIASLEELMGMARDLDVRMIACTMSMDAMAISREELVDGLEYGGVSTYLADAARSRVTLFV